jgi:hypothetical protein
VNERSQVRIHWSKSVEDSQDAVPAQKTYSFPSRNAYRKGTPWHSVLPAGKVDDGNQQKHVKWSKSIEQLASGIDLEDESRTSADLMRRPARKCTPWHAVEAKLADESALDEDASDNSSEEDLPVEGHWKPLAKYTRKSLPWQSETCEDDKRIRHDAKMMEVRGGDSRNSLQVFDDAMFVETQITRTLNHSTPWQCSVIVVEDDSSPKFIRRSELSETVTLQYDDDALVVIGGTGHRSGGQNTPMVGIAAVMRNLGEGMIESSKKSSSEPFDKTVKNKAKRSSCHEALPVLDMTRVRAGDGDDTAKFAPRGHHVGSLYNSACPCVPSSCMRTPVTKIEVVSI